jgi:hypothetical protein
MKNVIIGLILVVALGVVLYLAPKKDNPPATGTNNAVVTDYATCVSAGFPIAQTSPETCSTPDGRTFTDASTPAQTNEAQIITPVTADIVTSPMTIKAKIPGSWFFEANVPIVLKDENGNILAQKGYMTSEDWMTTNLIDVNTTLSFKAPKTDYGKLEIHNDNPSGDPENDKVVYVTVRFK